MLFSRTGTMTALALLAVSLSAVSRAGAQATTKPTSDKTVTSPTPPKPPAAFDLAATKARLTTEIKKALAETGVPSVSIALVWNGEVVWAEAFGYANQRMKATATADTLYCTGSTFKFVTATAIIQLADKGKLKLDDPVNKYLGEAPIADRSAQGKPVTFRHLLSHHSGLSDTIHIVPLWKRELPPTPAKIVSTIKAEEDPGGKWKYNNTAYALAGYLVEKISGQSYETYIVENILRPLGVTTDHPVEPSAEMAERMAFPYSLAKNKTTPESLVRFDVFTAGDIYLTASDMARFLAAQLNDGVYQGKRILSAASLKEMHTSQFSDGNYGLGTNVSVKDGHTILSHGGGVPGFNTYSMGDVESRVGVYIMANATPSAQILSPLCNLALKLLRGEQNVPPLPSFVAPAYKEITVATDTLEKYTGKFELSLESLIATITLEGNRLYLEIPNRGKVILHPYSETEFFLTEVDATVTFSRDKEGKTDSLTIRQAGQTVSGRRQK